jgi:hypothetical protein
MRAARRSGRLTTLRDAARTLGSVDLLGGAEPACLLATMQIDLSAASGSSGAMRPGWRSDDRFGEPEG